MRNPVELGMASVTRQPPAREEGGMVALSQMPTFLAVEQKNFYGELVTPSEVSGENVGVLVTTREEKTAPPKKPRLQKGHCTSPTFTDTEHCIQS